VARGFAAAKFFEKLAAIETGHLVIAKNDVGRIVNHFQQGVRAVGGDHHFAKRLKRFGDEIAH